ncbi:hypothetical protein DH2020_026919 [Rehmannia glutinosa]|uniref:K Homology domain-containing protein n=1 Tax=Rehmannia glutinosa TaxID=99300 RepID=A0ABR0VY14_REHGL
MGQRSDYGKGSHVPSEISGNEGVKRRNLSDEKEQNSIGIDDTVYRYLCPLRKIGSIIGIGGDIAKQLRAQTHARIRISETIPGVHDKVVAEESPVNGPFEEPMQVTVRLLVPEHLPPCALSSDELVQINGEATVVKSALYQVAFRLHDNPSRSQQSLLSLPSIYRSGFALSNPHLGGPPVGVTSLMGPYGNYKNDGRDWSSITKEFALRLVCPTENLGAVIGKGGATIKQIRHESGAFIVVDSSGADGDDCIISVSAKEMFEAPSRTIDAIMRLQPRCSEKMERDSGDPVIMTRLLVSSSKVGCIIGKGGAIIKEMRSTSRANIRIFSDENVPKVASDDDEMVQITGDMNAAKNALLQVMQRLRANIFENDGSSSTDAYDGQKYVHRDNRTRNPGYSNYSGGHTLKPCLQLKVMGVMMNHRLEVVMEHMLSIRLVTLLVPGSDSYLLFHLNFIYFSPFLLSKRFLLTYFHAFFFPASDAITATMHDVRSDCIAPFGDACSIR